MRKMNLEMWQLVQVANLIVSIQSKDDDTSVIIVRFRNSERFYQNEYYKILDFVGRFGVKIDLLVYRVFKYLFNIHIRNLVFDVQVLRQFQGLILRDEAFDDAEVTVPVPETELRKAIHLLTYYKYKYSKSEQCDMYIEGERVLREFYFAPGGKNS